MLIAIPRERKTLEGRIALTPAAVAELTAAGYPVRVEAGAGLASGYTDADYQQAGATRVHTLADIYAADLVVKVKEPVPEEIVLLRPGQLLFCYLHLAAYPDVLAGLLRQGVTALAFETLTVDGRLPLLAPMSAIAGRLAIQLGWQYLQQVHGGAGVLLGGVMDTAPGRVVVLGAGVAGGEAALMAAALGAEVWVLDKSEAALAGLQAREPAIQGRPYADDLLAALLPATDLVIGAVLVKGANAPRLLSRALQALLPRGRVVVDIAIDQGGCVEGIRATDWQQPAYWQDGLGFVAVTNMPGAVPRTSTQALSRAILPYVRQVAAGGLAADPVLQTAIAVRGGKIVHSALR